MFYVYILRSKKNSAYYVGCTDNIERRVLEHNRGLSAYTKDKEPWSLVYRETYNTLTQARQREKQIKSWKKRRAIEKLIFAPIV